MKRADVNAIESAATETRRWAAVVEAENARLSVRGLTITEVCGGKAYEKFLAVAYELKTALQKLPKRRRS